MEFADVELNGLRPSHTTRIRNGDGEGDLVVCCHLLFVSSGLAKLESGITQTMSEGEKGCVIITLSS